MSIRTLSNRLLLALTAAIALLLSGIGVRAYGQQSAADASIHGIVTNPDRTAASDASVSLQEKATHRSVAARTAADGTFTFSHVAPGSYVLTAQKSELHGGPTNISVTTSGVSRGIELRLENAEKPNPPINSQPPTSASSQAMEFADKPNFTVAGVTDWTAVGGHGSDSILRTSEDLARETLSLKGPQPGLPASAAVAGNVKHGKSESELRAALTRSPQSAEANCELARFYLEQQRYAESIPLFLAANQFDPNDVEIKSGLVLAYQGAGQYLQAKKVLEGFLASSPIANLHRIAGELDEKLGDPLSAVHEYEQAARMDPSEQNYFEWGSELLLHRAVWQAQEVFEQGTKAFPRSARMLNALGSALFAGALYDQAALRLCEASDLDPTSPEPYLFMGKIAIAAPKPLACIEPRLARFAQQEPSNSVASYLYAMAVLRRVGQPADPQALHQAETLLQAALRLDPHCAEAYLQLGVLASSQRDIVKAMDYYQKAIEANPQLGEAHYRLGVAYDRLGQAAKARAEFQQHDEIEKAQADAIEQQRREVKQFLVVLSANSGSHPIQ